MTFTRLTAGVNSQGKGNSPAVSCEAGPPGTGKTRVLAHLARARGVSEAELIRQAIDHHVSAGARLAQPDPEAWEKARRFMLALHAHGPVQGQPRNWKREDLYEERLSRHGRRSG